MAESSAPSSSRFLAGEGVQRLEEGVAPPGGLQVEVGDQRQALLQVQGLGAEERQAALGEVGQRRHLLHLEVEARQDEGRVLDRNPELRERVEVAERGLELDQGRDDAARALPSRDLPGDEEAGLAAPGRQVAGEAVIGLVPAERGLPGADVERVRELVRRDAEVGEEVVQVDAAAVGLLPGALDHRLAADLLGHDVERRVADLELHLELLVPGVARLAQHQRGVAGGGVELEAVEAIGVHVQLEPLDLAGGEVDGHARRAAEQTADELDQARDRDLGAALEGRLAVEGPAVARARVAALDRERDLRAHVERHPGGSGARVAAFFVGDLELHLLGLERTDLQRVDEVGAQHEGSLSGIDHGFDVGELGPVQTCFVHAQLLEQRLHRDVGVVGVMFAFSLAHDRLQGLELGLEEKIRAVELDRVGEDAADAARGGGERQLRILDLEPPRHQLPAGALPGCLQGHPGPGLGHVRPQAVVGTDDVRHFGGVDRLAVDAQVVEPALVGPGEGQAGRLLAEAQGDGREPREVLRAGAAHRGAAAGLVVDVEGQLAGLENRRDVRPLTRRDRLVGLDRPGPRAVADHEFDLALAVAHHPAGVAATVRPVARGDAGGLGARRFDPKTHREVPRGEGAPGVRRVLLRPGLGNDDRVATELEQGAVDRHLGDAVDDHPRVALDGGLDLVSGLVLQGAIRARTLHAVEREVHHLLALLTDGGAAQARDREVRDRDRPGLQRLGHQVRDLAGGGPESGLEQLAQVADRQVRGPARGQAVAGGGDRPPGVLQRVLDGGSIELHRDSSGRRVRESPRLTSPSG